MDPLLKSRMDLQSLPEITQRVLRELELPSLISYCRTNVLARIDCRDRQFWFSYTRGMNREELVEAALTLAQEGETAILNIILDIIETKDLIVDIRDLHRLYLLVVESDDERTAFRIRKKGLILKEEFHANHDDAYQAVELWDEFPFNANAADVYHGRELWNDLKDLDDEIARKYIPVFGSSYLGELIVKQNPSIDALVTYTEPERILKGAIIRALTLAGDVEALSHILERYDRYDQIAQKQGKFDLYSVFAKSMKEWVYTWGNKQLLAKFPPETDIYRQSGRFPNMGPSEDKELYLDFLQEDDYIGELDKGYLAFSPEEWLSFVAEYDDDIAKEQLFEDAIKGALVEGYTYWALAIEEASPYQTIRK